jgi:hypothetical protein
MNGHGAVICHATSIDLAADRYCCRANVLIACQVAMLWWQVGDHLMRLGTSNYYA